MNDIAIPLNNNLTDLKEAIKLINEKILTEVNVNQNNLNNVVSKLKLNIENIEKNIVFMIKNYDTNVLKNIDKNNQTKEMVDGIINSYPYMIKYINNKFLTLIDIIEMLNKMKDGKKYNNKVRKLISSDDEESEHETASDTVLKYIDKEFYKLEDNKLCYIVSENYGLKYIPSDLQTDEIIFYSLKYFPEDIKYVNNNFQITENIKLAIKENPLMIKFVKPELLTTQLIMYTLKKDINTFKYISKEFHTQEIIDFIVDNNMFLFTYFDKKFINLKLCVKIIKNDAGYLKDIPDEFKTYDICKIALKHGGILCDVPKELIDQNLIDNISDIKNNVKYIPIEFYNENIILILLNNNILKKVPINKLTKPIIIKALKKDIDVFKMFSLDVISKIISFDDIKNIVYTNPNIIKLIPFEMQNEDICFPLLDIDFDLINYINPKYVNNVSILLKINKCKSLEQVPFIYQTEQILDYAFKLNNKNIIYIKNGDYLVKHKLCIIIYEKFEQCIICHENKKYYLKYTCGHPVCIECKPDECYYRCLQTKIKTEVKINEETHENNSDNDSVNSKCSNIIRRYESKSKKAPDSDSESEIIQRDDSPVPINPDSPIPISDFNPSLLRPRFVVSTRHGYNRGLIRTPQRYSDDECPVPQVQSRRSVQGTQTQLRGIAPVQNLSESEEEEECVPSKICEIDMKTLYINTYYDLNNIE